MPRSTPSAARSVTDATRLARRQAPKVVGLGTTVQAAKPAAAAVSPRIGVYTLHLSGDSRRSRVVEKAPTAKPPRGPNATAENTSGRNKTDIDVRSVTPTLWRSATAATAPSRSRAQSEGSR